MRTLILSLSLLSSLTSFAQQSDTSYVEEFEKMIRNCKDYSKSYANQELCIQKRLPSQMVKNCHNYSHSISKERECRESTESLNVELLKGCYIGTSNATLQTLCMELRIPAPLAKSCKELTGTISQEEECLKVIKTKPEIVKGCYKYPSTNSLKTACIELNVPAEMARVCKENTSTTGLEGLCLREASEYAQTTAGYRD